PLGHVAESKGWSFLPCIGTLAGHSFRGSHWLSDHVDVADTPAALRRALASGWDAAWVRARLPRAFAYEPAVPEVEKALLSECFVASVGDDAFLFECSDHYGRTGLFFSPEGPDDAARDAIARAFWHVFLRDPDNLADFEARVFHPGAGVWLDYVCKD